MDNSLKSSSVVERIVFTRYTCNQCLRFLPHMYRYATRNSDRWKVRYWYIVVGLCVLSVISLTIYLGFTSVSFNTPTNTISSSTSVISHAEVVPPPDSQQVTLVWEMIACSCGGFQTEIVDTVVALYQSNTVGRLAVMAPPDCWCPGLPQDVVQILEFLRQQPYYEWDIDIFVRHAPPSNYILEWPYQQILKRPKIVVGRSMVEIDAVEPSMVQRLDFVDAVWVPSQHSLDAFVKMGAPPDKFSIVHEPIEASLYDPSHVRPLPLDGLRGFNFLSVFKWEGRKGVDLLLRAFFEEFAAEDDVSLIISSHLFGARNPYRPATIRNKIKLFVQQLGLDARANAIPVDRVIVLSERLPQTDMLRLYKTADAFVLPTHGEGWGLPVIEAMAMGKPTIATDYSGIREFLTAEVGFPIRTHGLEPAMGFGFDAWMRWASVDVAHLRELMRRVFSMDRSQREALGQRARQHVITNFSRAAIAAQVRLRVESLMTKFGLVGSAPGVCARELSAERARARKLGVLGTQAGSETPEDFLAQCTMHGLKNYYRQWEGRMISQYQLWPTAHAVDALPNTVFAVPEAIAEEKQALVRELQENPYASARAVYLASLPDSHTPTAADTLPWEIRKQEELQNRQLERERMHERRTVELAHVQQLEDSARMKRSLLKERIARKAQELARERP